MNDKKITYRSFRQANDEERKAIGLPPQMQALELGVTPWETIMDDDYLIKEDREERDE